MGYEQGTGQLLELKFNSATTTMITTTRSTRREKRSRYQTHLISSVRVVVFIHNNLGSIL